MHQEMDSIHTRLWAPTLFKKEKEQLVFKIKHIPKNHQIQYLICPTSPDHLNTVCHFQRKRKPILSLFLVSARPPWGVSMGLGSMPFPQHWPRTRAELPLLCHTALPLCSPPTCMGLVTGSLPHSGRKIQLSANKFSPPQRDADVLAPVSQSVTVLKHTRDLC